MKYTLLRLDARLRRLVSGSYPPVNVDIVAVDSLLEALPLSREVVEFL